MSRLEIEDLVVDYGAGRRRRRVVDGVNLSLASGSMTGLVGQSGSGKSTIARAVVGLAPVSSGRILLDGEPLQPGRRTEIQMVFQDPESCLDPRMSIGRSVVEGVAAHDRRIGRRRSARERRADAGQLLELMAIPAARWDARPQAFSGGQRQRIALARALAARPSVLLADEITSALDVSVQGSVLNALRDIHEQSGTTVLFISHNLSVVRRLCPDVAVLWAGRVVDAGPTLRVLESPTSDHTRQLLAAVPRMGVPLARWGSAADHTFRERPSQREVGSDSG